MCSIQKFLIQSVQAGFYNFSFNHIKDFMLHLLMDKRGLVVIHSMHSKDYTGDLEWKYVTLYSANNIIVITRYVKEQAILLSVRQIFVDCATYQWRTVCYWWPRQVFSVCVIISQSSISVMWTWLPCWPPDLNCGHVWTWHGLMWYDLYVPTA